LGRFKEKIARKLLGFLFHNANQEYQKFHSTMSDKIRLDEVQTFRKRYGIPPEFRFNGQHILFYGNGEIICGATSYIGSFSTVQAFDNCKVIIGERCSISHNVRMYTQSKVADQDMSITDLKYVTGNITIEDHAWIGANVFINPGVTIGTNSIVGANSVVTKDIPPNTIFGGVPAKLIREKRIQ